MEHSVKVLIVSWGLAAILLAYLLNGSLMACLVAIGVTLLWWWTYMAWLRSCRAKA